MSYSEQIKEVIDGSDVAIFMKGTPAFVMCGNSGRALEWVPYLHRWLGGPSSEALESTLVGAGAIPAIGYRWAGTSKPARR